MEVMDEVPNSARSPRDFDEDLADEDKEESVRILTSDHLHKIYVFGVTWSMGALLETADRLKFDEYLRENMTNLDLPHKLAKAVRNVIAS